MGVDAEMFAVVPCEVTDDELRELRWSLGDTFGAERFWVWDDDEDYTRHNLNRVKNIAIADGFVKEVWGEEEDIEISTPGKTVLSVSLKSRFYGEGYERGDFTLIYCVARWLEATLPGSVVYYGGDSTSEYPAFGHEVREEQMAYFLATGHEPYVGGSSRDAFMNDGLRAPRCPTTGCPGRTIRHGWGNQYCAVHCRACGRRIETHDGGKVWISVRNDKDEFRITNPDRRYEDGKWVKLPRSRATDT